MTPGTRVRVVNHRSWYRRCEGTVLPDQRHPVYKDRQAVPVQLDVLGTAQAPFWFNESELRAIP